MKDLVGSHLGSDVLYPYIAGKLDAAASAQVEHHVEACPACAALLHQQPVDSHLELLRLGLDYVTTLPGITGDYHPSSLGSSETPAPATDLPPEMSSHPRYRILRVLGIGGMGAVYQADHKLMNRQVALKVIHAQFLSSAAAVERFQREIHAASALQHPNIVAAYDAEEVGGVHFLVMEYVEGRTLAHHLREVGPLPVREACDYALQVALGLQHAHEKGMAHRDIKPDNLMLAPAPHGGHVVKVLDFGLARFGAEEVRENSVVPEGDVSLTGAGMVLGTPDYMAPEQSADSHNADIRADIYALGCTLYEMLTGRAPFTGGTLRDKMRRHREERPDPVRSSRPDVPAALDIVLRRMLAKNVAERYQTPAEVIAALRPFVKAPSWRRRALWAGVGLMVFLLAAIAVYRSQTDVGEVVFDGDNTEGEVIVRQNGTEVQVIDLKDRQSGRLPSGEYDLELRSGTAGRQLTPSHVTVRRGDTVVAAISRTVEEPFQVEGPGGFPALSPDGTLLAACSGRNVALFDARTGRRLHLLSGHTDRVQFVTFSRDGRLVASGGYDGAIHLWEASSGNHLRALTGHTKTVLAVDFAPDGRSLVSGGGDREVRLWNVADGASRLLGRHTVEAMSVAFHPDGKRLVSGAHDNVFRVWDVASGRQLWRDGLPGPGTRVAAAFSPDGRWLATGTDDLLVVRNATTFDEVWRGPANAGGFVTFTRDSLQLLTANIWHAPTTLPSVQRWEAATGLFVNRFSLPPGREVWIHPRLGPGNTLAVHYWGEPVVNLFDAITGTARFPATVRPIPTGGGPGTQAPPSEAAKKQRTELDFSEVHHIDEDGLARWLRAMREQGQVPVAIAAQPGGEQPRFAAVAVQYSEPMPWQFCLRLESEQVMPWFQQMQSMGYRASVRSLYVGPRTSEVLVCVPAVRGQIWGSWRGGPEFIATKARQEAANGVRPVALGYGGSMGDDAWMLMTAGPDPGGHELHFDLSADELAPLEQRKRRQGWRLEHISSFARAGKVHFAAVTVEDRKKTDWELHTALTTSQYEAKLAELRRRGLRPVAMAPYQEQGQPRYTAVWHRRLAAAPNK
jgi:hypothetical protein